MVAIARSRGINAHALSIENLDQLRQSFHGALSNFGALNCVRDLRPVAAALGRIIRPGGYVALCIMTRFCWNETLANLARLNGKAAFRRWRESTQWRGLPIYYPSRGAVSHAFSRDFDVTRTVSIGRGDHHLFILRRRLSC
jgi:hypothetical protein